MRDHEKLFKEGNIAQLRKLTLYSHKSDWEKMSLDEIRHLIHEEYSEVNEEIIKRDIDWEALKNELADLSNACHFGIQYCNKKIYSEKEIAKRDKQADLF